MEALFILLAEFLTLPVILMSSLVAELIAAAAAGMAAFLESVCGIAAGARWLRGRSAGGAVAALDEAAQKRRARRLRLLKRAAVVCAALLAVTAAAVVILNQFLFESAVRWGVAWAGKRAQVEITLDSASGNLFTGEFTLKGVRAIRRESRTSTFDLRADAVTLNVSNLRVRPFKPRFEYVGIQGLRGKFHRLATPRSVAPKRSYRVDHLRLEDVKLEIRDSTRQEELDFEFVLHEWDTRPLSSEFAILHLLFRSNASGEMDGHPFAIKTEQAAGLGRRTEWTAREFPIRWLGAFVGGPFRWFDEGTVDVSVKDHWRLEGAALIDMQWSFVFRNASLAAKTNAILPSGFMAAAAREYLRERGREIDIGFHLRLDEKQFRGAATVEAAGLGEAMRQGLSRELATRFGGNSDEIDRRIQSGIRAFRDHLDARRRKPDAETRDPAASE